MNIVYIPGEGNSVDLSEYIRRGADIDMEAHKIVHCAQGSADDDVVTIRGLAAYYRRGSPLNMLREQINNLAPGTSENDAVTLGQCTALLRKYDIDLSRSFSQLSGTAGGVAAGTAGGVAAGAAGGVAAGAATGTAAGTAAGIGGLASSGISAVTGVGGLFVAQFQRLKERFVAKPISEALDMAEHKIVNVAEGSENRDAVNFRQLSQHVTTAAADAKYVTATAADAKYLTTTAADAKYLTLVSADARYETANDARYVTRSALYELNYLNQADLPRRVEPLIEEAQTRTRAAIEARANLVYVQTAAATQSLDMQRHRIKNLPNSPLRGDAVSYDLLLEHSVKTCHRMKEGTIQMNSNNVAIIMKCNNCILPLSLYISYLSVYAEQQYSVRVAQGFGERGGLRSENDECVVLFYARERHHNTSRYRFTYFVIEYGFREAELTAEDRASATLEES